MKNIAWPFLIIFGILLILLWDAMIPREKTNKIKRIKAWPDSFGVY